MNKIVTIINREIEDFHRTAAYKALFMYNYGYYIVSGTYSGGDLNGRPKIMVFPANKKGEVIDWHEMYAYYPCQLNWAEIDKAIMLSLDNIDERYYI